MAGTKPCKRSTEALSSCPRPWRAVDAAPSSDAGSGVGSLVQNPDAHCRAFERPPVKKLVALTLLAFASSFVHAADSACMAAAKEKKLAGAAQKSFVKKCETEAKTKCEAAAAEKKLAGAAKASNVKKCVQETGPAA